MATITHLPALVQLGQMPAVQILPADASNRKVLITGSANGDKIVSVMGTSTDSVSARDVQVWLQKAGAGVFYLLITVSIPANSGNTNALFPIQLFTNWSLPTDNDGQKYLFVEPTDVITIASTTTVTAAKEMDFWAVRGAF